MPSMRKPLARLPYVLTIFCILAAIACLPPGPAAARTGYSNVQCSQAQNPQANLQQADHQMRLAAQAINYCGPQRWDACLQARNFLFSADNIIAQILNWNSEQNCRNCRLDALAARASTLAQLTQSLRFKAGPQLTINTDNTYGIVASRLNDPGCCPPNTRWNARIGNCQSAAPPRAKKKCIMQRERGSKGQTCKAYEKLTQNGLRLEIVVKQDYWAPPADKGYKHVETGRCPNLLDKYKAKCKKWNE